MAAKFSFASRRLSDYETVLDLLRTRGDGVICHVMIMRTKTEITASKLSHALQSLMHHQPALRMRIKTERGMHGLSKRFVESDDVDIDVTEADGGVELWEFAIQETCCQQFVDPGGKLWKLLYMDLTSKYPDVNGHTYAIIFKISNVIADHVSLYLLMTRQLRMILIGSQLSTTCTVCKVPLHFKPSVDQCFLPTSSTPVAPPLIKLKKKGSNGSCLNIKKRQTKKKSSSDLCEECPFFDLQDLEIVPRTRLCRYVLELNDAKRLIRLCRRHDVRIEQAFVVASAHAYYLTLRAQRLPLSESHVRVCHWLDLRRYHSAPTDCDPLGMWLCPVYTKHKPNNKGPNYSTFWQQVRKLSNSLAPVKEPWKQGFQEFRKSLDEVNKHWSENDEQVSPSIPRCHVTVSYLEVALDTEDQMMEMARSRHGHVPVDFDPMIVDEYHVTTCVTSHSIGLLNVSVVQDKNNIACVVSRDDNVVPFVVAEKFLAILSKIISHMVSVTMTHRFGVIV
ncbi:hypothetical protein LSH36_299g01000 [Paralvinella palmiformis]|uniref:Uncharacterized protein n=1 Tax=Paralvinella palmiformis TaxID=53620 RepID=A0AAD9N2S9_9ANNE|nr:hypothetical protein LSH36_299g01000 [Paralvinella palmiformis]